MTHTRKEVKVDAVMETITADAVEFGRQDRQGEWRKGLLVARSVQLGKNHGVKRRDVSYETSQEGEKTSAREFAMLSGTSTKTVMKYYRAWEKAAKEGLPGVLPAADLVPGQE